MSNREPWDKVLEVARRLNGRLYRIKIEWPNYAEKEDTHWHDVPDDEIAIIVSDEIPGGCMVWGHTTTFEEGWICNWGCRLAVRLLMDGAELVEVKL